MNKKGMTLIELIISIAMLSGVLVFMYGLMVNLQKKKNDSDAYTDNFIKIAEIETEIQKSIMGYLNFGRDKLGKVRIWNDLWCSNNDINNPKNVNYHGVRIDMYDKNNTLINQMQVSLNPKTRVLRLRRIENNTWVDSKLWTLDKAVAGYRIGENCQLYNSNLYCQIYISLYNDEDKIIDAINMPIYIPTNYFFAETETDSTRRCKSGYENAPNCSDPFVSKRVTSLKYESGKYNAY